MLPTNIKDYSGLTRHPLTDLNGLHMRNMEMLLDRMAGNTYVDIAAKYGICASRVKQICDKEIRILKRHRHSFKQLTKNIEVIKALYE